MGDIKSSKIADRLAFLAETFDVYLDGTDIEKWKVDDWEPTKILTRDGKMVAVLCAKKNLKGRIIKKVSINNDVFAATIAADPTENKMYIQWILNLLVRLIKSDDQENQLKAMRLVEEDLPLANTYLTLFDANKRKQKFKNMMKGTYLQDIEDPSDINQYKTLSELFDAVDPFIEKNPTELEKILQRFVDSGQALMPVKDRKFTLYIPKTRDASVVFGSYAGWCTAVSGNGNFASYKRDYRKPNGQESDIYIIINNKFFIGESEELVQIHFETNQIKDKRNGSNIEIYESILSESVGISNFFYNELLAMAKQSKVKLENNKYLDYLIRFGFHDSLFEFIEEGAPSIHFMKRKIPKLPDLSKFTEVEEMVIADADLVEIHPSVCKLPKLEMLSLPNNKLRTLPSEIGLMKNLMFLNIKGNPITHIPNEIKYLDRSLGGKLFKVTVTKQDIGAENFQRLKELLPTADI